MTPKTAYKEKISSLAPEEWSTVTAPFLKGLTSCHGHGSSSCRPDRPWDLLHWTQAGSGHLQFQVVRKSVCFSLHPHPIPCVGSAGFLVYSTALLFAGTVGLSSATLRPGALTSASLSPLPPPPCSGITNEGSKAGTGSTSFWRGQKSSFTTTKPEKVPWQLGGWGAELPGVGPGPSLARRLCGLGFGFSFGLLCRPPAVFHFWNPGTT